jgi:SNF2 family DNA or RNA helicase
MAGTLEITRSWHDRRKAASIPGAYWSPEDGAWVVEKERVWRDDRTRAALLALFPTLVNEAPPGETDFVAQLRPVDLATPWAGDRPAAELLPNVPEHLRELAYRYQVIDTAYLCARMRQDGGAYFGWSRGLGKTLAEVLAALELRAEKVAVVAPASSKETVHAAEWRKWAPEYAVFNCGGSKAQRDRAVAAWWHHAGPAVLLIHYEALRLVDWKNIHPDLLVCDEAHRLAKGGPGRSAPQFYRALKQIKARYRLALSGSIVVNSPEDMFGALHWLFPKVYKSRWKDWNNRWISYVNGAWGMVMVGLKEGKLPELHQELAALMCVRRKEDELPGLPPKVEQTLFVELSPSQRKVYNDLRDKFLAELPDGSKVMSASVVAQLVKLRQIATGLDLLGEGFTDSSKLDLAIELIEDNLPNKTVVFAWHRATVDALVGRLQAAGVGAVGVHGGVPMSERTSLVEAFQQDTTTKVIVATIKTLGESVTLHAAADLIFVESSWTPTDMEQAADRVHRIGQERHVTITTIAARDTIDEHRILPTVRSKAEMRRLVLGGNL